MLQFLYLILPVSCDLVPSDSQAQLSLYMSCRREKLILCDSSEEVTLSPLPSLSLWLVVTLTPKEAH